MYRHLDGHELPSYQDAISQDHWKLIAPYIASQDLCSTSRACSRWHEIFAPQLWGNPASHFGTEDDSVYVALTRFRRTLPWARLYVRQMTHTLHLPPAHAEIYEGPHPDWLRDMLERLPRLQCLVVEALPFFDHGCLMALRTPLNVRAGPSTFHSACNMRLLNASNCFNATYSGLAAALHRLEGLLYIDLSETTAARNRSVLERLADMQELKVVKLKKVGLNDDALEVLARAIGARVRSLDLSDNTLTDKTADLLLRHCIKNNHRTLPGNAARDIPIEIGGDTIWQYHGEALERHLRDRLTTDFVGRLAIQDDADPGLTHLFTSGNRLTVDGISHLIQADKLEYLDAGAVLKQLFAKVSATSTSSMNTSIVDDAGAEKIVTALKKSGSERLTYLRIDHEFATEEAVCMPNCEDKVAELPGSNGETHLDDTPELDGCGVSELDAPYLAHELEGDPVSELEGDSVFQTSSRKSQENSAVPVIAKRPPTPRRGSEIAPEAVTDDQKPGGGGSSQGRPRTYSSIVAARKARAAHDSATSTYFRPSMLPKLQTLVLCNVPEKTKDRGVSQGIIRLVEHCAEEYQLAKEEACHSYLHPPGRSQKSFESEYIDSVFSLKRIVLEMADPSVGTAKPLASWRMQPTSKATTEDPDSEAFWDAAQQDFTFFDEEECGQPRDKTQTPPSWFMDPVPMGTQPESTTRSTVTQSRLAQISRIDAGQEVQIDVIAEISKFRRDRKTAKRVKVEKGVLDAPVKGHWEGDIQVHRPYRSRNAKESKDCYGNVYEKGFRYR